MTSRFITKPIKERILLRKRKLAFKTLTTIPPTLTHIPNGKKFISETRKQEDRDRAKRMGI